jgi:hypothetical protein
VVVVAGAVVVGAVVAAVQERVVAVPVRRLPPRSRLVANRLV